MEPHKSYSHFSQTWYKDYAKSNLSFTEEVTFSFDNPEGGCFAEMAMRWHLIDNKATARLEVFSDAFSMLFALPELQDEISSKPWLTPDDFCLILESLGFVDKTDRERK